MFKPNRHTRNYAERQVNKFTKTINENPIRDRRNDRLERRIEHPDEGATQLFSQLQNTQQGLPQRRSDIAPHLPPCPESQQKQLGL